MIVQSLTQSGSSKSTSTGSSSSTSRVVQPLTTAPTNNTIKQVQTQPIKTIQAPQGGFKRGDLITNVQKVAKQAESAITQLSNGIKLSLTQPTLKAPIPQKDIVKTSQQQALTISGFKPGQKQLTPDQFKQLQPDLGTKQSSSAKTTITPQSLAQQKKAVLDAKIPQQTIDKASKALKQFAVDQINGLADAASNKNDIVPFTTLTQEEYKKLDTKQKLAAIGDATLMGLAPTGGSIEGGAKGFSKLSAAIGFSTNAVLGYLRDANHSVKDAVTNPENIVYGLLGGKLGAGKGEDIIKPGEHAPQEIIDHVVQNDLTKTPDGKAMLKTAVEAQKQGLNIAVTTPKIEQFNKTLEDYRSFGGKTAGTETPNAALRDIATNASTPEIQAHTQEKVQAAISSGELKPNKDGTITLYRGGGPSKVNDLTSATYDKSIAEDFAKSNGGTVSEIKVKPQDIQAFIGKAEKEVLVKNDVVNAGLSDTGLKVSKIAKEIEAKAVEKGFIENGLDKLAGFNSQTFKEQSKLTTDLINNHFEDFKAIIRGEKPLPKDINPSHLVTAAEEYIKQNPHDLETLQDLAKSHIVSKVSEAAQILGAARTRDPYTPLEIIKRLENDNKAVLEKEKSQPNKIGGRLKAASEKVNLPKEDLSWEKFFDSIKC